ncbi:MAG: hypothetical protein R2758_05960 [Bacteroidales bacterium]
MDLNEERGLYKTIDGGRSWTKILSINQNAGAFDIVLDPATEYHFRCHHLGAYEA